MVAPMLGLIALIVIILVPAGLIALMVYLVVTLTNAENRKKQVGQSAETAPLDPAETQPIDLIVRPFISTFFSKHRKLIALLILIVLWLSIFPIWMRWVTENPLDEPISLAPRGVLQKEVRVVIPENYELNFVFERAGISFDQLKVLLGDAVYRNGKIIPSGIRVPIRWSLRSASGGEVVASGEIDSFGLMAWGGSTVDRSVGHVRVDPGRYIFNAEILRDVQELAHIKTRISMRLTPKAGSTWQIGLVWWGQVANLVLIRPAAAIIVLFLMWRAGLTFRSRRRGQRPLKGCS